MKQIISKLLIKFENYSDHTSPKYKNALFEIYIAD